MQYAYGLQLMSPGLTCTPTQIGVGTSPNQQQRSGSGRMITDLEMNDTLRGAVEVSNLACHLRHNDVLFPECIRTFQRMWYQSHRRGGLMFELDGCSRPTWTFMHVALSYTRGCY